jgi:hypothetical protein
MTKKWSSTKSMDGQTKRQASKGARRKEPKTVMEWLEHEGAVEAVKYDEDTGKPYRVFTIDLTK